MDEYVDQLIEELELRLFDSDDESWDNIENESEKEIKSIDASDEYINAEARQLQHIIDVKQESLPEPVKLTDNHISRILDVLEMVIETYNFEIAYPSDSLSNRIKYTLLRNKLTDDIKRTSFGKVGIEFCGFWEDDCPIPGECNACKEMDLEMANYTKKKTKNLSREEKVEKIANAVKTFTPKEGNISGIFNYCDRWCERCDFTDRCSNYEMSNQFDLDDEDDEEDLALNLEGVFKGTFEMIEEQSEKMGIDLSDISDEPDIEDIRVTEKSQVHNLSEKYSKQLVEWFKQNKNYLSDISSGLFNTSRPDFLKFNDAIEIINWYMIFISAKINRAYTGFKDDDEIGEYDKDGSAKVALIAIDKSIEAFTLLMKKLKPKEDEILTFLSML